MSDEIKFSFDLKTPEKDIYSLLVQPFSSKCKSFAWMVIFSGTRRLNTTPHAWIGWPSYPGTCNVGDTFDGFEYSGKAKIGDETESGSTWTLQQESDGHLKGFKELVPKSAPETFEINVPSDLHAQHFPFLAGMALRGFNGQPVPVSAELFQSLDKDLRLEIKPIHKFFIVKGRMDDYKCVDFDAVTKNAGVIDFSAGEGLGRYHAKVTHKDDGSWEVKYE